MTDHVATRAPTRSISRRALLASATAATALPSLARAQSDASRPIDMIVPFEPGAAPDLYARVVAEAMRPVLGRVIVVENKPGVGGNIGAAFVARAPADGSTLLVGTTALCEINPLVFDHVRWSMKDFAPIIKGVGAPLVLVAHPSVPARTLDELVAWIKSKPHSLAYASYNAGAPGHFLGAQLNLSFGLDLEHVPYRGSASQVTALLAGQSPFGFAQTQNSLPHIQSGDLRAIAITSANRYRLMPEVATFQELGHPEFTTSVWFGLLARAGTPNDALDRITGAAIAAHNDAHVRDILTPEGYDMLGETGDAFGASIEASSARWAETVKATGFRVTSE